MLQVGSRIKIADNTGAKEILCINIPGRGSKKYAAISDIVIGVVKKAEPQGMVEDAAKVRAVIVRTRKNLRRKDGSYICFDDNAAVILEKGKTPKGSRVFGPIAREIKEAGYGEIASMAKEVL